MKDNFLSGYAFGRCICIIWNTLFPVKIEIDGKRFHHYELGIAMIDDKDAFWRGFGQALIDDDKKDLFDAVNVEVLKEGQQNV